MGAARAHGRAAPGAVWDPAGESWIPRVGVRHLATAVTRIGDRRAVGLKRGIAVLGIGSVRCLLTR